MAFNEDRAGGTPVDRHSFTRSMSVLAARLEVESPLTPYELRHTAFSLQADAGASAWEIADWAGTSEAMIGQVYLTQATSRLRIASGAAWASRLSNSG